MYEETRSIQRHGKQKDRGIWPLLTVPSPSYMIMGGKSGSIDILGMITYMAWPVIMKRGCTTNQELIDAGIMFKADTIEGLARKDRISAETLAATLKKYNDAIEAGEPDEFGRGTAVYASNLFDARRRHRCHFRRRARHRIAGHRALPARRRSKGPSTASRLPWAC